MEFHGFITDVTGFPGRPTLIVSERETGTEKRIRINDIHGINPVNNVGVNLFLNGNLLASNNPIEVERLVIVTVYDIRLNENLFLLPEDYRNKSVFVSTPHHLI